MKQIEVGRVKLKNNLVFAPLAGYSDVCLREVMTLGGAGLTVTEMVSVKSLIYGNEKTGELLDTSEHESVKCVQLFGSSPDEFFEAAQLTALSKFDIIDVNMGCPVKKIVKNGEGSALIGKPDLCGKIVAALKRAGKTVSVKTRLGIDDKTQYLRVLEQVQANGVDMISVHLRTAMQMYTGEPDYSLIKDIRRVVSVPLAINGNITDSNAGMVFDEGADLVMIGRGALSNPNVFNDIISGSSDRLKKKQLVLRLIDLMEKRYGDRAVINFRKLLPYVFYGISNTKELRRDLSFTTDIDILKEGVEKYL